VAGQASHTSRSQIDALGPLEVDDEHDGRQHREDHRHDRAADADQRRSVAEHPEQRRQEHGAGRDALEEQVQDEIDTPCLAVRNVVVDTRIPGPGRIRVERAQWPQMNLALAEHEWPGGNLGPDGGFIGAEVEDLRPRPFFRLAQHERLALHNLRDFARRIVQVAEDAALGGADAHARRLEAVLHAICAEVALLGCARVRIDEQLIVRARRHARAAADARLAVQIDDAVAAAEERARRTDVHARSVGALIAEDRQEQPLRLRKRALLDGLDPAAIHADRDVVFRLAGDRAGVTPDALAQIDRKPVVRHRRDYSKVPADGPDDRPLGRRAIADSPRDRPKSLPAGSFQPCTRLNSLGFLALDVAHRLPCNRPCRFPCV
jgi:hypothetical protein